MKRNHLSDKQLKNKFKKLLSYVKTIKGDYLRGFVENQLCKCTPTFINAPASKKYHHNYKGGLLIHTLECVELLLKCLDVMKYEGNRDILLAACILHDFGKCYEYIFKNDPDEIITNEVFTNKWINHSHYMFYLCNESGFTEVAKIIACHHGRIEWGAVIDLDNKLLKPEHCLIHLVDMISSRIGT